MHESRAGSMSELYMESFEVVSESEDTMLFLPKRSIGRERVLKILYRSLVIPSSRVRLHGCAYGGG